MATTAAWQHVCGMPSHHLPRGVLIYLRPAPLPPLNAGAVPAVPLAHEQLQAALAMLRDAFARVKL